MQIIDEDGFSDGTDIEDDTLVGHNVRTSYTYYWYIATGNKDHVEGSDPRISKENLKIIDVSNCLLQ